MGQKLSPSTSTWWSSKVHPSTIQYLDSILSKYPCLIKSSRARKTKLGDFRVSSKSSVPTITVNNNLDPTEFLITLVHEVAHLFVWNMHGRKVQPHGTEWKGTYVSLLRPLMEIDDLDSEVKSRIHQDILNPRASCRAPIGDDTPLALGMTRIEDVMPGEVFMFRNREFTMMNRMRTRYLCLQNSSGRKYAFQAKVIVKIMLKSK